LVSTSIGTNKSFLEQGINPNTATSPEPTGTIFSAAKAFNQGLKQAEPAAENNIKAFSRASKSEKSKQKNTQHQEKQASRGFAYKVFEGAIKNFTKIIWTSVPAEAIANSVTDTQEALGYSKILEKKYQDLLKIKEETELSPEEAKKFEKLLEDIKAAQLDPSKTHFNALSNNLENTYTDSFVSKFVTDFSMDLGINIAAKIPVIKNLNPMIVADYISKPIVFMIRSITAEKNMSGNAFNKAGEVNEKQQKIIDEMSDTGVARLIKYLRDKIKPKVQPIIDGASRYVFGITPGYVLKDKEGRIIRTPSREVKDENGNITIQEGQAIRTLAKINPLHFAGTALTSLFLTIFALDKNAQATGYQGTHTWQKALLNMAINVVNRLDTTMISTVHTAVRKGSSFLDIFYSNVGRKLIVPTLQSFADAISNLLGGGLNPATKAILGRLVVDFTAPPFVQSLTSLSDKKAIDHETQYVAHKFIKPVLIDTIGVLKNAWMWWGKNCYAAIGIYPAKIKLTAASSPFWAIQQITSKITGRKPKDIPGLFDNDIEPLLTKGLPEHLRKFEGMSLTSSLGLAAKRILTTPLNIAHWTKESFKANKDYVKITDNLVNAENALVDLKARRNPQALSLANNIVAFKSEDKNQEISLPKQALVSPNAT
jgi:polyhydroxyalkanoate synthesis regulator phasin